MAMIVADTTYRNDTGSHTAAMRVEYEPKISLYEVNLWLNGELNERGYFDNRKDALSFASTKLMALWLNPPEVVEEQPVADEPADDGKFRLDDEDDTTSQDGEDWDDTYLSDDDAEAAKDEPMTDDERMQLRRFARHQVRRILGDDPYGHIGNSAESCRCGDCLTYMAGN